MAFARGCAVLCVLFCIGCDSLDRERDEARRFLSLYDLLNPRDVPAQRKRQVEALSDMPLHTPSVQRARDACVSAHRALLNVERSQETAAKALDAALTGRPNGEPLNRDQVEEVERSLSAADSALSDARAGFVPCEAQARSLSLRFSGD